MIRVPSLFAAMVNAALVLKLGVRGGLRGPLWQGLIWHMLYNPLAPMTASHLSAPDSFFSSQKETLRSTPAIPPTLSLPINSSLQNPTSYASAHLSPPASTKRDLPLLVWSYPSAPVSVSHSIPSCSPSSSERKNRDNLRSSSD